MRSLFKLALAAVLLNVSLGYANDRCEGCGGGDNKAQEIIKTEQNI